jgi:hypothetical protein
MEGIKFYHKHLIQVRDRGKFAFFSEEFPAAGAFQHAKQFLILRRNFCRRAYLPSDSQEG